MRNFADSIDQSLLNNVKYRNKVVTGVVAVDNGNYTYDTYISSSTDAYPNIPTTMKEPDFTAGDAVEILMEYGNKEMPIIIGLAKKVVQEVEVIDINPVALSATIFVVYQVGTDFYLNSYDNTGTLVSELGVLAEISGAILKICVDSNQNIYIFGYDDPYKNIYKYDKDGNCLFSKTIVSTENYFTLSPDGYIYTLDSATRNLLRRRNLSDLEINGTVSLSEDRYYYLTFDSDGYAYLYAWNTTNSLLWGYVKYELGVGQISKHLQTNSASNYDSWCVAGNYIGCVASQYTADAYTIDKSMGADRVAWDLDEISTLYKMTSTPNYFICLGVDSGGKLIIEEYTPGRVRQWKTEVATSFTTNLQYCGIGSYPF